MDALSKVEDLFTVSLDSLSQWFSEEFTHAVKKGIVFIVFPFPSGDVTNQTVPGQEFFRKFAEIFASQSAPPVSATPVANLTPVANCRRYQRHRRQICHRYQRHRRQTLPPVSLVLLTPAANLPPVSTTPVANCHRYQRHRRQICRRCRWHRWQIIRTVSGCRHLKVNLKAKM